MRGRFSIARGIWGAVLLAGVAAPTAAEPPLADAEKAELDLLQKPESWFRAELGKPHVVDGQTLHPKLQYQLEHYRRQAAARAAGPPPSAPPADPGATAEGRAGIRAGVDRSWTFRTRVSAAMAEVRDETVSGRGGASIPVRVYRPVVEDGGALPVLVYFHGGGWLFGSVAASDRATRLMANEAQAVVISVDYRLAPEHPYPAAWDDAEDAYAWALSNAGRLGGDPSRVGVGGDSAGGNLAINVSARRLKQGKAPPRYQLLYYPAVDVVDRDYPSFDLFGEGYGLDAGFAKYATDRVFPDGKLDHAEASPLLAASIAKLPPTIIATGGFDILRDSVQAYARRLDREGVSTLFLFYPSLNHGFLQWSGVLDDADRAATESARIFGRAIRSVPRAD